MEIDNIQLTSYLCEKMFAGSLVDLTEDSEVNSSIPKAAINSLGENKRNILFLVSNDRYLFLADDEMILLSGLLSACRISMADIALVNFHQCPATAYGQFLEVFQPKKILLFGVTAADVQLPFTIPFFQIQKFEEQVYLICPSLSKLINNKKLKQELWVCLQKVFLT